MNTIIAIKKFKEEWNNTMTIDEKIPIALKTDSLNNQGCDFYQNGQLEDSKAYFQKALELMPINDDALLNLARCFTKEGQYNQAIKQLIILYIVSDLEIHKNIVIGYTLLKFLLEDLDGDEAAVSPSSVIDFLSDNNIDISYYEIKVVVNEINEPYNRDIIVGGFNALNRDNPYMTADGTYASTIKGELLDILNW